MPSRRIAKVERKARIKVHNRDLPTGTDIDVGYNGVAYKIQEGKEVAVPVGVLGILRNAVIEEPVRDAQGQILRDPPGEIYGEMVTKKKPRFFVEVMEDPTVKSRGAPTALEKEAREKEAELQKIFDKEYKEELREKEKKEVETKEAEPEVKEEDKKWSFFGRNKDDSPADS